MADLRPVFAVEPLDLGRSVHIGRRRDVLECYGGFDDAWYRDRHPDVEFLGCSALDHFLTFGGVLGRGINHEIPRLSSCPGLEAALFRRPIVSYCTSIMNRPNDVRGTLSANLGENRVHAERLEFVLVFLDEDLEMHRWVREEFASDLRSGYLRMIVDAPLSAWHFGRAKNVHRRFASGRVFSSLDGDNFVTEQETDQLLEIYQDFGESFIFHHFSGNWGDGSSGRVSSGMRLYEEIGYDETFLPRQYDELDFILSTLTQRPDLPLIRFNADNHGLSSVRSKTFIKKSGVKNRIVEIEPVVRRFPLNPKEGNYVDEDRLLGAMQSFNQFMCFAKNAGSAEVRSDYIRMSYKARQSLVDIAPREGLFEMIFGRENLPPRDLALRPHDVCTFSCVKNDELFLPTMYSHYKSIGVRYMFFVDDGSSKPIRETLPHGDVFVVRPRAGAFVTSKTLWLEALMNVVLEEGRWALTVDADELVDLPPPYASLSGLVEDLERRGRDFIPGLLVDMLPADLGSGLDGLQRSESFDDALNHYAFVTDEPLDAYLSTPSVRWAFGPFARLSWTFDVRYHAFGTFDSLRKIPLSRVRAKRHLNQGFHTLHYTDDTPDPDSGIWEGEHVLPIRHFKLLKLFSEAERARTIAQVASTTTSQYHARTTENIRRIFGDDSAAQIERLMSLPRRPYADGFLKSIRPDEFLEAEMSTAAATT
ncbi:MAG: hypothetical protein DI565_19590 [Ancylobacter novellus]|uniref:Glycosyl transferase family 2 n=1 Tax=Ancylobacter novellus TaxID=921 RepID=A0A2W5M0C8_ANCNO|nr:MAG: hypothetical protein DI565_19590 [Ancylobacter novellus]